MEPIVATKMKEMQLEDLLSLLWSALEINRGSNMFYDELENQLTKRLLRVKDDEL